ncbi:MAG: hypothetical protein HZA31_09980 [Opitutae bacterium]|nr:hypothetical protein [Opitutae bacterium]
MKIKYWLSLVVCLAMWAYFRREHPFTAKTWAFLIIAHLPALIGLLALERKKTNLHPILCFLIIWIGGFVFVGVFGKLMGLGTPSS